MIDKELLDILVCPETKQPVHLAEPHLVERVNTAIRAGRARKRSGGGAVDTIDGGLVRDDGKVLYPVRDDIPIMLIDEALVLEGL